MKQICLFPTFICIIINVNAQNSSLSIKNTNQKLVDNRWDLSSYLWSQIPTSANQKKILDFDAIENWSSLGGGEAISSNGEYFTYTKTFNEYKNYAIDSLVVQSTKNSWRKSFAGASPGFFSGDGGQYIFQNKGDLYFLKTGNDSTRIVPEILSYKKPLTRRVNWICYALKDNRVVLQSLIDNKEYHFSNVVSYDFDVTGDKVLCRINNAEKELVIFDLPSRKENTFSNIKDYMYDAVDEAMVFCQRTATGDMLEYKRLSDGYKYTIWSNIDTNLRISGYTFDSKGQQLAFTVHEIRKNQNSIWYWRVGMEKAVEKINNQSHGINEGMVITGNPMFTGNDRYIRFNLSRREVTLKRSDPDAVQIDIWNYKDSVIQATQLFDVINLGSSQKINYSAFFNIDGGTLIEENERERISIPQANLPGDFIVLTKSGKNIYGDRFWRKDYYTDSNWIVSLKDGSRVFLCQSKYMLPLWFSSNGKYLVYFDKGHGGKYYSYNFQTRAKLNISVGVPKGELLRERYNGAPFDDAKDRLFGLAFWEENLDRLFVYGKYDIWQLDLNGRMPAVNITKRYGRLHHVIFRLMGSGCGLKVIDPVRQSSSIFLTAFNEKNQYNGFYRLVSGKVPELLYMGPCVIDWSLNGSGGMVPLKATDSSVWIVKRQSDTKAPNYFLTSDFRNYKTLTDWQPQKKFAWLNAEIYKFKQLDGSTNQGVLYKPENFDSSRKYPVIISFYFAASEFMNFYLKPELMTAPVAVMESPGWFVSHGYLVFTPDIDFSAGHWGPATVNSIEGAARYLSKLPFVDGQHIAASGHSNSGRFGYYLLTHSKRFAAMCVGSGTTDAISFSLSLDWSENSSLESFEVSNAGYGLGSLWRNKTSWLDHTAVLSADRVSSPLLLFHNKKDGVPIQQAIELFTALRRLEKRAWWIQYDDGKHRVIVHRDIKDYTIRYTQFFDHYLKNAPAPRWMTQGIPATLKAVDSGYDLDPSGTCDLPDKKNCPICKAWNAQYKRTPVMFTKPIAEWKLDDDLQKQMKREETKNYNDKIKDEVQHIRENNMKLKGKF